MKIGRVPKILAGAMLLLAAVAAPGHPSDAGPAGSEEAPEAGLDLAWFPVLMSSPETGVGFGAAFLFTYQRDGAVAGTRPQTLPVIGLYTTKSQTILSLSPEVYLDRQRWRLQLSAGYSNFPDLFYGIGNRTAKDAKEDFVYESVTVRPSVLRQVVPGLSVGVNYDFTRIHILEREPGGRLDPASPGAATGAAGGDRSGLGPALVIDTRNHLFYPTGGVLAQVSGAWYRRSLGSDYDFEALTVDLRRYQHLGGNRVFAVQFLASGRGGDVPFGELPKLGDYLRGVLPARYRDRLLVLGQAELRLPLSRRFNATAFAGLGDVVPDARHLSARRTRFGGGLGLRWAFDPEERVFIRFDLGIGGGGAQPYFNFGEAF